MDPKLLQRPPHELASSRPRRTPRSTSCPRTAGAGRRPCNSGPDSFTFSGLTDAEQTAEQQAAKYRVAGLTATCGVGEGKPAAVILDEAEKVGADLIVIGNVRMQGAKRVLGAVANDVLHHAPCDVLLVKTV